MNNTQQLLVSLILFVLNPFWLSAQSQNNGTGSIYHREESCIPQDQRLSIQYALDENRKKLGLNNTTTSDKTMVEDLLFPLKLKEPIPGYFEFYGISALVDHDPSSNFRDYNCLARSYDGHRGSDIYTFPFEWFLYEEDLAQVISAFEGTIILKDDGNSDTNCQWMGSWNAVYIQHSNGSTMWYGHLKSGSLTTKSVGDSVQKGEYLGVVASSGNSTGPHLHIEYYDANDNLLDPYQGDCNSFNSNSLWEEQQEYIKPRINAILSHSSAPNVECGPLNEVSDLKNEFHVNETVYVGVYLTDYQIGEIITTTIYRPNNTVYADFDSFNNDSSFAWFWNSRSFILDQFDPVGTWTVQAELGGETFTHQFEHLGIPTSTQKIETEDFNIFPNPTNDEINIDLTLGKDFNYSLLNYKGEIIKNGHCTTNTISLADLPTGLYYLTLKDENTQYTKKLIKY